MRWLGLVVLFMASTAHAELTKDQVRKTIKANLRTVIACYETTPPPDTSRQIIVTFTVATSGKVTESVRQRQPAGRRLRGGRDQEDEVPGVGEPDPREVSDLDRRRRQLIRDSCRRRRERGPRPASA